MKEMTKNQFDKNIQELIDSINTHAIPFANDTPALQRIRVDKSRKDMFYFAQTYFPHYIRSPFGAAHKEMHAQTSVKGQITAIAGFRGLGKTTLLAIIKPIWLALYGNIYFNVKVAKNKELAKERTLAIRCEFLYNGRLKADFGDQLPFTSGEEHDFVIKQGTRFLGVGYQEGIRGKIHNAHRPDYIDIDDLEDHHSFNPKIAQDKLQFVTEEAYGAFEKSNGCLVWLGNLTHQSSALNLFFKSCTPDNPSRRFLIYKADDGHMNPTWPEHFTRDDLLQIYQAVGKFGYERHYRMNPLIEGLKFKEEWFRYYDPNTTPHSSLLTPNSTIVAYCDPSLGDKSTSDYKAIITVTYCEKRYYLLDIYIRKASILDMLHYMYTLYNTYKCRLYMESNFWQKVVWEFIPQLSTQYKQLLPLSPVENREKKELRIESLQPLFEWGWILFPSQESDDLARLKDQLLGFPAYPNDDGPDALAGAISNLKIDSEPLTYQSIKRTTKFSDLWG